MFEIYIMVWLEKEMEGNWEDIEIHKAEKVDKERNRWEMNKETN